MAEREILGQGVVEMILEDAKIKPALAAIKKLIEDTLGPVVGNALGGGAGGGAGGGRARGGKRGALAGLAAQAAKDGARAGKAFSKSLASGLVEASKTGTRISKSLAGVANQAATSGGRMASELIKASEKAARSGVRAGASIADSLSKGAAKAVSSGSKAGASMASDWSRAATSMNRSGSKALSSMSSTASKSAGKMTGAFGRAVGAIAQRMNGVSAAFGKSSRSSRRASRQIVEDMRDQGRQAGLLRRTLGSLTGGFKSATGSGLGFGGMLTAVAGGSILANMISKITQGIKGLLSAGFNTSSMLETLTVSFTKMVGSEKAANKLLGTLREFSTRTPLQFPDITKAGVALLATQKIAQDKLLPTIEKLTDVAAGSTEGFAAFPRIVRAITQTMSKGRIQAEEMMQLAEAGIPAWDALAKEMGMSIAQVRKLGEEGKLGTEAITKLIDGLGKKYEGLALKQSKTWGGLVSTFRDILGMRMSEITKPWFALAKVKLGNLIEWTRTDKAEAFFKTITDGVSKVAGMVEKGMNSPLLKTIAVIAGVTAAVFAIGAAATAAGVVLSSVFSPIGLIVAGIAVGVQSLKKSLDSPAGKEIRNNLIAIKDLVVEIGTNSIGFIKDGLSAVKAKLADVFGFDAGKFWVSVTGGLKSFLDTLSLLTTKWDLTWKAATLGAAVQIAKIEDSWLTFVNTMKTSFMGAVDDIVTRLEEMLGTIQRAQVKIARPGEGKLAKRFRESMSSDQLQEAQERQKELDNPGSTSRRKGIEALQEELRKTVDEMGKTREDNRRARAQAAKIESKGESDDEKKEEDKPSTGGESGGKSEGFGRTDLEGLHDAVQDALTKKDDPALDEAKKQTGVLEDIRDGKGRNAVADVKDAVSKGMAARDSRRKRYDEDKRNRRDEYEATKSERKLARDEHRGRIEKPETAEKPDASEETVDVAPVVNAVDGVRDAIVDQKAAVDAVRKKLDENLNRTDKPVQSDALSAVDTVRSKVDENLRQQNEPPKVEIPKVEPPKVEVPNVTLPDIDISGVKIPDVKVEAPTKGTDKPVVKTAIDIFNESAIGKFNAKIRESMDRTDESLRKTREDSPVEAIRKQLEESLVPAKVAPGGKQDERSAADATAARIAKNKADREAGGAETRKRIEERMGPKNKFASEQYDKRVERRESLPDDFDLVADFRKRLEENLANRGEASGEPATASDIKQTIRETLDAAGMPDTGKQIDEQRQRPLMRERYEEVVATKDRIRAMKKADVAAAEESRQLILQRKIAAGTAKAIDHRRPLTEAFPEGFTGRSATESGRMIQEKKKVGFEDAEIAKMLEQFTERGRNQGLIPEGQTAIEALAAIAPATKMESGDKSIGIQQAMLDELKKSHADSGKLVGAVRETGDKIASKMGYGE